MGGGVLAAGVLGFAEALGSVAMALAEAELVASELLRLTSGDAVCAESGALATGAAVATLAPELLLEVSAEGVFVLDVFVLSEKLAPLLEGFPEVSTVGLGELGTAAVTAAVATAVPVPMSAVGAAAWAGED